MYHLLRLPSRTARRADASTHRNTDQCLRYVGRALVYAFIGIISNRAANAQQSPAPPLVFDDVTVVDVAKGTLLPHQRIVIDGNHIQAVGNVHTVAAPNGAHVVSAKGLYAIPGLWDMHISPSRAGALFYPRLLAYGITGIRNAGAPIPLDTLQLWRQEILRGIRIGPPRQILTPRLWEWPDQRAPCFRNPPPEKERNYIYICVEGVNHARHVVDSLKAAGADMITVTGASRATYFTLLNEARYVGLPFGGKDGGGDFLSESDSGARIVDDLPQEIAVFCVDSTTASVERCQPIADKFRRNDTWVTVQAYARWMSDHDTPTGGSTAIGGNHSLRIIQQVQFPILAMAYIRGDYPWRNNLPGSTLHETLADLVARGITPLAALQSATLNPARAFHATDTLGTIAPGKLADLVLLGGNPLASIANTTSIRAVVANGRYLDRAALDQILADTEKRVREEATP